MSKALGMDKYQETALNNVLHASSLRYNGLLFNAKLHNGFHTNFQGCYLTYLDVGGTSEQAVARLVGLDADLDPYYIQGAGQLLSLRSSDATPTASTVGFPNAAAANDTGVLRLQNRDVNGANACALMQENALWIAPNTNFSLIFDIAQWTQRSNAVGVAFAEFGVASTCSTTHIVDASKQPAYNDGTDDYSFATIKLYGNQGRVVCKATNSGAVTLTSPAFDLPAGNFSIRLEYSHGTKGGTPTIAVYVDGVIKTTVSTSLAGPFQLFGRVCHGASYLLASHAPTILDIDSIVVALPA